MAQTCSIFQVYFVIVTLIAILLSALLNISTVGAQDSATAPLPAMDAGNASGLWIFGESIILASLVAI